MRHAVFTPGKMPHVVVEVVCDSDMLVQMIRDGDLDPNEVVACIGSAVEKIQVHMRAGLRKRAEDLLDGQRDSRSNDNDGRVRGAEGAEGNPGADDIRS